MPLYTLTNSNAEESELFVLGDEGQDAVVLFSTEEAAKSFMDDFELADEFQTTPLEPIEVPQLMVDCNEQDVPFVLVNPTEEALNGDEDLTALNVAELLSQFGQSIVEYIES